MVVGLLGTGFPFGGGVGLSAGGRQARNGISGEPPDQAVVHLLGPFDITHRPLGLPELIPVSMQHLILDPLNLADRVVGAFGLSGLGHIDAEGFPAGLLLVVCDPGGQVFIAVADALVVAPDVAEHVGPPVNNQGQHDQDESFESMHWSLHDCERFGGNSKRDYQPISLPAPDFLEDQGPVDAFAFLRHPSLRSPHAEDGCRERGSDRSMDRPDQGACGSWSSIKPESAISGTQAHECPNCGISLHIRAYLWSRPSAAWL